MTNRDEVSRGLAMTDQPMTEAGRWLLAHQGLINIGKIVGSMRGDEIDLAAAILAIEAEARAPLEAEIARLRDDNDHLRFILSFHNLTPTGQRRDCGPKCIACAALEEKP